MYLNEWLIYCFLSCNFEDIEASWESVKNYGSLKFRPGPRLHVLHHYTEKHVMEKTVNYRNAEELKHCDTELEELFTWQLFREWSRRELIIWGIYWVLLHWFQIWNNRYTHFVERQLAFSVAQARHGSPPLLQVLLCGLHNCHATMVSQAWHHGSHCSPQSSDLLFTQQQGTNKSENFLFRGRFQKFPS